MAADAVAAAAAAPLMQTQEAAWLGQPMHPHLQMQQQLCAQHDHDSPSARAHPHTTASLSTQQRDGDGSLLSDAGADLQQLESRVVQLSGELLGVQRALAAALQAALPQDLQAACTISATQHSTAAPGQGPVLPGSPDGHCQPCPGACPHSPGSRGSPTTTQARPRRLRSQQQEQQGTNRGSHVGHGGSGYCCCCGGVQPGPLEAALEDGVAAFVLHCVQQLRGGAAASRQQTAGTGSLPGPSSRRVKQTASGAALRSNSRSASPVTRGSTTGAGCGADGGSASSTAQAAQGRVVGGGRDAGGAAAGGELLARLLLEQLHSYSRQHLSAYDGLSISFGQEGQQGVEGMQQVATASSSRQQQGAGGAAAVTAEGLGGVEQGGRLQWPAAPLPGSAAPGGVNPVAMCAPGDGAGSSCAGLEEGGTTLQLPALPSLLNNMGRAATSQQLPQHAEPAAGVVAAAASSTGCRNRSPVRADRDGLFDAVLSELRPWGGAPLACSTAAPLSPSKAAPTGGTTAGLINRSRTPTSPAAVPKSDVFRCSPLSPPSKGHTRTAGQL